MKRIIAMVTTCLVLVGFVRRVHADEMSVHATPASDFTCEKSENTEFDFK